MTDSYIEQAPGGEDTSPAPTLKLPLTNGVTDYYAQIGNLLTEYVAGLSQGDILYYSGTNFVRLAPGTSGQFLKTQGAAANPVWALPADLAIASQAQGDILYFNGTNWVRLAAGTSGKFLKTQGAAANPAWDTDRIVQVVHSQSGAVATGTTTIPYDDTVPQNTEGTEFMTLAITPTNASNKLLIDVTFYGAASAVTDLIVALFQDSTANALAAVAATIAGVSYSHSFILRHEMTAGTTSATTFKVRAGGSVAATITFNGFGGARKFGGVAVSSIRITEVKV